MVRGCLFTLLLAAVVIALAVVFGLPALASAVVTGGLTAAGLQADDTTVKVHADPPTTLLGGKADEVDVHATHATFRGMAIGTLDLRLHDVNVLDRTAASIDGTFADVTLPPESGGAHLRTLRITGGQDRVAVATIVPKADVEAMIADGVEAKLGVRPSAVSLAPPDVLTVQAGVTSTGRLRAQDGDLVVDIGSGPAAGSEVVLLRGGTDLPMEITKVRVTDSGDLRIEGTLSVSVLG